MTKPWDQLGVKPWDFETQFYVDDGANPGGARIAVILKWMSQGDLRPLAAAIKEGHHIPKMVLGWLAYMIDEGQVVVKARARGRQRKLENGPRNLLAGLAYHHHSGSGLNSEKLFEAIAEVMGTSPESVRQAVTIYRKSRPQQK